MKAKFTNANVLLTFNVDILISKEIPLLFNYLYSKYVELTTT